MFAKKNLTTWGGYKKLSLILALCAAVCAAVLFTGCPDTDDAYISYAFVNLHLYTQDRTDSSIVPIYYIDYDMNSQSASELSYTVKYETIIPLIEDTLDLKFAANDDGSENKILYRNAAVDNAVDNTEIPNTVKFSDEIADGEVIYATRESSGYSHIDLYASVKSMPTWIRVYVEDSEGIPYPQDIRTAAQKKYSAALTDVALRGFFMDHTYTVAKATYGSEVELVNGETSMYEDDHEDYKADFITVTLKESFARDWNWYFVKCLVAESKEAAEQILSGTYTGDIFEPRVVTTGDSPSIGALKASPEITGSFSGITEAYLLSMDSNSEDSKTKYTLTEATDSTTVEAYSTVVFIGHSN